MFPNWISFPSAASDRDLPGAPGGMKPYSFISTAASKLLRTPENVWLDLRRNEVKEIILEALFKYY